jgi:hypothetical protein
MHGEAPGPGRSEQPPVQFQFNPFPPIGAPSFETVFLESVATGLVRSDFSVNCDRDVQSAKERALSDLLVFFKSDAATPQLLPEPCVRSLMRMVSANLFDRPVQFPGELETADFTVALQDPTWFHLSYCYSILRYLIVLFPLSPIIGLPIVLQLFRRSQCRDIRERNAITGVLTTYYKNRESERVAFIRHLGWQLHLAREVPLVPYCAVVLLNCFLTVLEVSMDCLTDDIVTVVVHSIVPLVRYRYLSLIAEPLRNIFCQFTCKYPNLTLFLLHQIQLTWPVTTGTKQPLFMRIVMALLALMDPIIFEPCAEHFFLFIADCLDSANSLLISEILTILSGGNWTKLLQPFGHIVVDKLIEPLTRLTGHWNFRVRTQAKSFIASLQRMNSVLVNCKLSEVEAAPTEQPHEEALAKWTSVIALACQNGDFDRDEKLAEAEGVCICPVDARTRNLSRYFGWKSYRTAVAEAASTHFKAPIRSIRVFSSPVKWPKFRPYARSVIAKCHSPVMGF